MAEMIYFTIDELSGSERAKELGIDNTPDDKVVGALTLLVREVLDPARALYGKPIRVSSGYRCPTLNKAVGGSIDSQHQYGEATDLTCDNPEYLFDIIRDNLAYDQLIYETKDRRNKEGKLIGVTTWIHVSYRKGRLRNQHFRMHNGKRI